MPDGAYRQPIAFSHKPGDVLGVGRKDVERRRVGIVDRAVGTAAESIDLLNLAEPVSRGPIDAKPVVARIVDHNEGPVGSQGMGRCQLLIERLPAGELRRKSLVPKDPMVPTIDDEIGIARLDDGRGRVAARLPVAVVRRGCGTAPCREK